MMTYETMSENDSDSDLSDPPMSPNGLAGNTITVGPQPSSEDGASESDYDFEIGPTAFVKRKPEFEERVEDGGGPEDADTPKDSSVAENSQPQFLEFTDIDEFEEYLKDPEDMSYKTLYNRTARVAKALVAYQEEFEALEKETSRYETVSKAQKDRAEEMAKEREAKRLESDDVQRGQVAEKYSNELKLGAKEWEQFLTEFEKKHPADRRTLTHLQNLRDPSFMGAVQKRLAKREPSVVKAPKLINGLVHETKQTKEEKRVEKKKRLDRALDPVVFDDRKMADVYGFEWSSKEDHEGCQPLEKVALLRNNADGSKGRSIRKPRQQNRKRYDDEDAGTSGPDDLPAKRAPKPRSYTEEVEAAPRRRTHNRDANHPVKVFPSGKRVGRPPAKSKLQTVQRAVSPAGSLLAPAQEDELHEAAEALVNQTVADQAAAAFPMPKKKHAGGRPKKALVEKPVVEKPVQNGTSSDIASQVLVPDAGPSEQPVFVPTVKRKHAGGRPKKNPTGVEGAVEKMIADLAPLKNLSDVSIDAPILPDAALALPAKKKHAGGRPKKEAASLPSFGNVLAPSIETAPKTKPKRKPRKRKALINSESELELAVSQAPTEYGMDSRATTSTATSRPTTSSSGQSSTSFGNVLGTRRSTRAMSKTASSNLPEVAAKDASWSVSSGGKRKRSTQDTDSSTLIVDPAPVGMPLPAPPAKKRKVRAVKQETESADASPEPSSQASRPKRKRTLTTESTIAVADPAIPHEPAPEPELEPASPSKKRKTVVPYSHPPIVPKPGKKGRPPVPAPRAPSTRVRKPTRALLGLDGADEYEEEDELEQQFRSEYDHFQALTSPKNPAPLGKRNRKSVIDLAAAMQTEDEEDYYY